MRFRRADGVWAEQQKLSASDGASFRSVALDGDTAVFMESFTGESYGSLRFRVQRSFLGGTANANCQR